MGFADRIAELEQKVAEQRVVAAAEQSRLRGFLVELEAMRQAAARPVEGLAGLERTEAIAAVLQASAGALSASEVVEQLLAAGRVGETEKSVQATLSYLLKQGRVTRPVRGRYATR